VGEGTFCEETGEHCLANARVTSDYNGWHRERVCSVVAAGGAARLCWFAGSGQRVCVVEK
jgi:hypothetical protein